MAIPAFRRAVEWLADPPEQLTFDQRIALAADRLRREGYTALASLAAAEAIEIGRLHGLRYDRIEHDGDTLRWYGVYETGPMRRPTVVLVPLEHATEAEQRGVASTN